jgi:hemerythrin-like domain-containing protein
MIFNINHLISKIFNIRRDAMKPTEILMEEHRVIEQVLATLERMADLAETQGTLNPDHARDAVEFFRNFADRCHHGKEETHLFTMMEARGFPREGGPTGVMLHEHEQGRAHVRNMAEMIAAAATGEEGALQRWAQHARAYIGLLSQHIQKEDHCLFAMADQTLTAEDQTELAERFEHVEHEHMGLGTHERYLKIANDLADAYGIPRARVAAVHGGCGCGCGHKH